MGFMVLRRFSAKFKKLSGELHGSFRGVSKAFQRRFRAFQGVLRRSDAFQVISGDFRGLLRGFISYQMSCRFQGVLRRFNAFQGESKWT